MLPKYWTPMKVGERAILRVPKNQFLSRLFGKKDDSDIKAVIFSEVRIFPTEITNLEMKESEIDIFFIFDWKETWAIPLR